MADVSTTKKKYRRNFFLKRTPKSEINQNMERKQNRK